MHLSNEVVLRPRFKIELEQDNEAVLRDFENTKTAQKDFVVTRVDDHIYLKIPKDKQHFWSPQLHLEIMKVDDGHCRLFGLFGPNPTVWTMFMFFHFLVVGLFIAFGIWTYTNWSLGNDYAIQLFMMLFMIVIWAALYYGGRIGKATGKDEMYALHNFMTTVLNSK